MQLSALVRTEVFRHFSADDAQTAIQLLQATPLPFLDEPDRETDRQRVQLAAVKYAAGDLDKLRQATQLAHDDWRDLLMATGLGGENWRMVLARDGFPVP